MKLLTWAPKFFFFLIYFYFYFRTLKKNASDLPKFTYTHMYRSRQIHHMRTTTFLSRIDLPKFTYTHMYRSRQIHHMRTTTFLSRIYHGGITWKIIYLSWWKHIYTIFLSGIPCVIIHQILIFKTMLT
jgi:hypothetical protein